ncbi:hypothetical protein L218DRAFT_14648 [Marasmius fiardii PR-910]|nr:hypothetical protein L218DRAFT_14648 [Marasmius fiardii PR-910]
MQGIHPHFCCAGGAKDIYSSIPHHPYCSPSFPAFFNTMEAQTSVNGLLSGNKTNSSAKKSKSPQRLGTDPTGKVIERIRKRIIVCCDGTWQDGISVNRRKYTNVLVNTMKLLLLSLILILIYIGSQRLARTIDQEDVRTTPPTPQIVFYQSGIGSEKNFYSEYVEGTTGATLADKVEEAYAFIAHNYFPGDEIFLFGFSRVRSVALHP